MNSNIIIDKSNKMEDNHKFIENVNNNDLKEIESIGKECLPLYYNINDLQSILACDYYIMYKLIINNVIIGYVIGEISPITEKRKKQNIHIMSIAIRMKYQNKGYGTLLLKFLKDITYNMTLNVHSINEKAINFYKKNRFKIKEIRTNYYESLYNPDAYFMEYIGNN